MTAPGGGQTPPQHSHDRKWVGFGVQEQALPSDCPLGLEIGPRLPYNGGLEGGKWAISDEFFVEKAYGINDRDRIFSREIRNPPRLHTRRVETPYFFSTFNYEWDSLNEYGIHAWRIMMSSIRTVWRYVVVAFLLLPFGLRMSISEPYPAILLPSGSGKLTLADDSISFNRTELWVIRKNGAEHRLETRAFLGDIPNHYWKHIALIEFGFARHIRLRRLSIGAWTLELAHSKVTPTQRNETIQWLHRRLAACGVTDAAVVRIRWIKATKILHTGEEVDYEILREFNVQVSQ